MSTHDSENSDEDWVKRYRQASNSEAAMPSSTTRQAILAEGRRVAALRAANPTTHVFDPGPPAANQSRWKLAAAGTLSAALFATVLMYPRLGAPPIPRVAEIASTTMSGPAPAAAAKKQGKEHQPAADSLEEAVITGARQSRPPARTAARKTQSSTFPNTATLDTPADAMLRESHDAASPRLAGAQSERRVTSAASPLPAPPSARSAEAVRSNLVANDSLLSSVAAGDLARVSALLNEGATLNQIDRLGRTPLLLAVIAHREDLVELLLAHHADPNAADLAGETPLQRARLDDQLNIARLLERAGAL